MRPDEGAVARGDWPVDGRTDDGRLVFLGADVVPRLGDTVRTRESDGTRSPVERVPGEVRTVVSDRFRPPGDVVARGVVFRGAVMSGRDVGARRRSVVSRRSVSAPRVTPGALLLSARDREEMERSDRSRLIWSAVRILVVGALPSRRVLVPGDERLYISEPAVAWRAPEGRGDLSTSRAHWRASCVRPGTPRDAPEAERRATSVVRPYGL